jgi:filamentous hemagglutinin family protein
MLPLRRTTICVAVSGALCAGGPAYAQITTDGTLGSAQALAGPNYAIPASLGRQAGGNLFHSFGQFNVPTAGSATFAGPGTVSNIISRVTGGQASSIDGVLRSTIANANLFLINPRGIVFGPGASLDLTGSFHASTAHYLKLADGTRFEATATMNPILTAAPPAAFGFLGPAGPINVRQGSLQLATRGQSLSLVGGPVNVSGATLGTAAGDLHLVGTAGAGEVTLAGAPTPGIALAPVMMQRSSVVASSALDELGQVAPPGRIVIRGGELRIAGTVVLSNSFSPAATPPVELIASGNVELSDDARVAALAQGAGRGADIVVRGENTVSISSAIVLSRTLGSGQGGLIVIEGHDVHLLDGAFVSAEVRSTGAGGSLQARATERFLATGQDAGGSPSFFGSLTQGTGDGGSLSIQARDVHLSGGIVASVAYADGNAGAVTIDAENVRLETGSPLPYVATVTSTSAGTGDAGPVTVRASGSLTLDGSGFNALIGEFGATQLNTETLGPGRVANIVVESPLIVLDHGARIAAESWDAGDNGSVLIRTHDLTLRGQAEIRSIRGDGGTGRSGGVRIDGTGRLTLGSLLPPGASAEAAEAAAEDRGSIFTTDNGLSVTGDIVINMAEVHVGAGSEIATASGQASAGAVRINAQRMKLTAGNISTDMFTYNPDASAALSAGSIVLNIHESLELSQLVPIPQLALGGGGLITSLTTGSGPGGDIVLSAPYILLDEVVVQAAAVSSGRAGNIVVRANDLFMRNGAQIVTGTEPTATGGSGSIEIDVSGRFEMSGVRRIDGFHAGLSASTRGSGGASAISVRADSLVLDERAFISSSNEGGVSSSGGAGSIDVRARTVDLAAGATIRARSLGSGTAGSIRIEAGEALRVFDQSTVNTQATSTEGGNITLGAPRITVESGGQVVASASGAGNAGQIQVRAGELLRVDAGAIASETTGSGTGGRISLTAPRVEIVDGGIVTAGATGGAAGQIDIRAGETLRVVGGGVTGQTLGGGPGGSVSLSAPRIEISGGGAVAAISAGDGNAGQVDIVAGETLLVASGQVSTATVGRGTGGRISLSAPRIDIVEDGTVTATSFGSGEAGRIDVRATDALRVFGGSSISTNARSSDGGNIDIRVGNLVHLKNSEISTAVGSGQGGGGNIFIDPTFVILENSRIVANAFGGPGGNIQIFATYFLNTLDSLIDASSAAGVPGTVSISAPNTNLSTQLKVLPTAFFDASALVREACSGRFAAGAPRSSLVGVGRGGLAASPERFATSTYFGTEPPRVSSGSPSTGLRPITARRARLADGCAG